MASSMLASKPMCRPAAFTVVRPAVARPARVAVISNSYKNKENIDLSRVDAYKRSPSDTGSPEYQVARLTARITQLSGHLQKNKKDHAAKRGLQAILNERKVLLRYLYRTDREKFYTMLSDFGIRSPVVGDVRGAARDKSQITA